MAASTEPVTGASTAWPPHHLLDLLRAEHHCDNHIGAGQHIRGAAAGGDARLHLALYGLGADVMDNHLEAGAPHISGRIAAHGTKPDESDYHAVPP